MDAIAYIVLLSLTVFVMDVRQTARNMDVPINGFGAIAAVLAGRSLQPMQYRVLVPYMAGDSIERYMGVKLAGIVVAVGCTFLYFSVLLASPYLGTAIMVLFLIFAAIYDYADTYWEVGLFAFAFWLIAAQPYLWWLYLIPVTVLASMNRETAIFIPICLALSGEYYHALIQLGTFGVVVGSIRLHYGHKERYCSLWMVGENIRRIRDASWSGWEPLVGGYTYSFVLLVLVGWSVQYMGGGIEWGMLALFCALLVPTVWREVRVFAPCMLAVIPALLRGVL